VDHQDVAGDLASDHHTRRRRSGRPEKQQHGQISDSLRDRELQAEAQQRTVERAVSMVVRHGASFEARLRAYAERTRAPELAFMLHSQRGQQADEYEQLRGEGDGYSAARRYERQLDRARRQPPLSLREYVGSMALRMEDVSWQALLSLQVPW
jgi:hypothetical protein